MNVWTAGMDAKIECEHLEQELRPFVQEVPTCLRFGWGMVREAAALCRGLGRRALLVTGRRAMQRCGKVQQLTADLKAAGIATIQFADLHAGPTSDDIDRGADVCRSFRADFVLAFGGGTAIDGAKAIAAVAPGGRPTSDYLDGRAVPGNETLPIVAIPTTSGTGSELNRSAIITDPRRRCRDGIRSNWLFPRLAIVDPELMSSLGPQETACTAFDAMSHAIESYVSPRSRPATDRLALRAIQSVSEYLPLALADPQNEVARQKLALASTTMGINLCCVGTCFPHRVDKAICGLHPEMAHGQSVAIFYPHWISFSYCGNVPRFALIAELLEAGTAGVSAEARASRLPRIMQSFLHRIGLDRSLADYGVTAAEIPDIVARINGDLAANPIPVSRTQLTELVTQAFHFQDVLR